MDTATVQLEIPRDLLGALEISEREFGPTLRLLIALELFREEKLSSGTAAEGAGLSKTEFIYELDRRGISHFTETPEELGAQLEAHKELRDGPDDAE